MPRTGFTVRLRFNVTPEMDARVRGCAERVGLDLPNFLRLVLAENLPRYERQAERLRQGGPPSPPRGGRRG